MDNNTIYTIFEKWNEGRLQSYLIEITRDIFDYKKKGTDTLLLDDIKDEAKAKGTGKWTSQAAMDLNLPIPIIDIAVSMRDLSKYKDLRIKAAMMYPNSAGMQYHDKNDEHINKLEQGFYFAMVSAYAQGMHLLYRANEDYNYNLNLDVIAKIWRGGCIIRSEFLEDIYAAYKKDSNLKHLFLDDTIQQNLVGSLSGIRSVVSNAALHGIATPAFAVALSYFDNFRSEEMPANLIQAQRDFFGSHTYELKGKEGTFHTEWEKPNN